MIEIKDMEGKVLRVVKDANDLRKAVSIACGEDADLRGADLRGADLRRVNLSGGDLGGANLQNATLQHSHLSFVNLSESNLSGADLSGVRAPYQKFYRANLCNANLNSAYFDHADLRETNMSNCSLRGTSLSRSCFQRADLRGADMHGAFIRVVDFYRVDLSETSFSDFDPDPTLPKRVAERILETTETTRLLAGWAVHLSGVAGSALESLIGTRGAGYLLMPSAANLFYCSADEAREWAEEVLAEAKA